MTISSSRSDRTEWTGEYRFARGDGSYANVFDRGLLIRNEEGKPLRMVGSLMDVTSRKEIDRMKSDFVSFASHQLRTPLAGERWMLELAADAPGLPDDAREYIRAAQESNERLVAIVNDLLDMSRLEGGIPRGSVQPVDLVARTRSILDEMRSLVEEKSHRLVMVLPNAPRNVRADQQWLRQAITNLVSNAIKYTPGRGTITVTWRQPTASFAGRSATQESVFPTLRFLTCSRSFTAPTTRPPSRPRAPASASTLCASSLNVSAVRCGARPMTAALARRLLSLSRPWSSVESRRTNRVSFPSNSSRQEARSAGGANEMSPDSSPEPDVIHRLKNHLAIIAGFSQLLLENFPENDPRRGDIVAIHNGAHEALTLMPEVISRLAP